MRRHGPVHPRGDWSELVLDIGIVALTVISVLCLTLGFILHL